MSKKKKTDKQQKQVQFTRREGFASGKWSTDATNRFSISPWSAASLLRQDRSFTAVFSTVDDEAVLISLLSKEECTGLWWEETVSISSRKSFCSCFPAVRIDWITPTNWNANNRHKWTNGVITKSPECYLAGKDTRNDENKNIWIAINQNKKEEHIFHLFSCGFAMKNPCYSSLNVKWFSQHF